MNQFTVRKFSIPQLKGISAKNIEEHLKLYEGYVKNSNIVREKITDLSGDREKNTYLLGELARRFSFEFNGMRNHEVYFSSFENGPAELNDMSALKQRISETWGSFENWLAEFKFMGLTRGIGWAMLYYDRTSNRLINSWVDEQHLGQLNNCATIVAMDMWEHSYVFDYQPSGKKNYIEDFFANLNWKNIEANFDQAVG